MRALITGIAGFAGTHLAEHLLASGDDMIGVSLSGDWGDAAHVARLPLSLREAVAIYAWDMAQPCPANVRDTIADFAPEIVYHLAAISKAEDVRTDAESQNNENAVRHALALGSELASQPRLLFVSSSYVYGERVSVQHPLPESTPCAIDGAGAYASSKMAGEALCHQHCGAGGDAVIARAFQHSGPRQSPRFMLAEWCAQFARADRTPVAIKHANTWLDLSDVRDVVRAYRLLAIAGERGETYNVGSGVAVKTWDIFRELHQWADPTREVAIGSREERFTPIAETTKLAVATGWQPEIPLSQTIRDTYAWFK